MTNFLTSEWWQDHQLEEELVFILIDPQGPSGLILQKSVKIFKVARLVVYYLLIKKFSDIFK